MRDKVIATNMQHWWYILGESIDCYYIHESNFHRNYVRKVPRTIFDHNTDRSCLAYSMLSPNDWDKQQLYQWKDVDCHTEAPFICHYNQDFLGFHKVSDLDITVAVDIDYTINDVDHLPGPLPCF